MSKETIILHHHHIQQPQATQELHSETPTPNKQNTPNTDNIKYSQRHRVTETLVAQPLERERKNEKQELTW